MSSVLSLPKKSTPLIGRGFSDPGGVTGRDAYILAKALAYAIQTIEALPERWQEWSDCRDMQAILEASCSLRMRKTITTGVRLHLFQEDGYSLRTDAS
jgi:hypothetical protein